MRPASKTELTVWLQLIANRDKCTLEEMEAYDARAFVLDDYSTDTPGYQGPVGIIIWPGSPQWITQFEMERVPHLSNPETTSLRWKIGFDSVAVDPAQRLESDPRGDFERVNEELEKAEQGNLCAVLDNNPDEVVELFETGSVTLRLLGVGKSYELTLHVKELAP